MSSTPTMVRTSAGAIAGALSHCHVAYTPANCVPPVVAPANNNTSCCFITALSDPSYDYSDEEVASYAARGTLIGSVKQTSFTGEHACHP
eukprot:scaffold174563_cov36-Attheya_sp.AAC.1